MTATASRSTSGACSKGPDGASTSHWARGVVAGCVLGVVLLSPAALARGGRTVVGTPHDLSHRGLVKGAVIAESRVCVFCHTGHMGVPDAALWSRGSTPRAYIPYSSPTMNAATGQPDGASKLCLSCHDGALASDTASGGIGVGWSATAEVLSVDQRLAAGAIHAPGQVKSIGPDLSDDHPVSFVYDAALAIQDGQLAMPEQAPSGLGHTISRDMLDRASKMQCTSCHNAHDNGVGNFLKLESRNGTLCTTCHDRRGFEMSAHSPASSTQFKQGCASCHMQHGAARTSPLLTMQERDLCGSCHRAQADAMRPGAATRHRLNDGMGPYGRRDLTCATCHEPHVVRASVAFNRQVLTDPDDRIQPPTLIEASEVPYSYAADPRKAAESSTEFCMDCHDGTWPGAPNVLGEMTSPRAVQTEFRVGRLGLHASHTRTRTSSHGVGCTYCHDAHGTTGNRGIPRGRLLHAWLTVNEFPYVGKRSCSTSDVLGNCHGPR